MASEYIKLDEVAMNVKPVRQFCGRGAGWLNEDIGRRSGPSRINPEGLSRVLERLEAVDTAV